MKTIIIVMALVITLSACTPVASIATLASTKPIVTQTATTAPATATLVPSATLTANATSTATLVPSATATSTATTPSLSLVAVGDSIPFNSPQDCPGCEGFVKLYGEAISKATGLPVNIQNLSQHNGLQIDGLLGELKTDTERRDALAKADIIVVSIGHNDTAWNRDDDPCDGLSTDNIDWTKFNPTCAAAAAEVFRPKFENVFTQIAALRAGKPTIFRTVNVYNDWIGDPGDHNPNDLTSTAKKAMHDVLDAWNLMVSKAAKANGFTVADIYHAFNGQDGFKPAGILLGKDYIHPTEAGNIVITGVLADLGYAPLVPVSSADSMPVLSIQPSEVRLDQAVAIRLTGFEPNQEVTLRATTVGTAFPDYSESGKVYESYATFRTDSQGTLDVGKQAPLSGTYSTVDGMGLFWSMTVTPSTADATPAVPAPNLLNAVQYHYTFNAEVNGKAVAQATVVQDLGSADVVVKDVAENGVLGQFYQPSGKGPFPAVIALVGSQGGLLRQSPKVLAADGYAVLSLAYFNYTSPLDNSSLPDLLDNIPLEYFGKAIQWLQSQPEVDPGRIGLIGFSVGGTAALQVAATYSQIKTVIVYGSPTITFLGLGGPSFSYQGKPVPYANTDSLNKFDVPVTQAIFGGKDPMSVMPEVVASIKADPELSPAIIPVEKIKGSVLLISGDRDSQLDSVVYGELAVDRLKAHNFSFPYRHIIIPGAGHLISFPYAQRSSEIEQGGGSPQANAQAAAVTWPVVLEYLAAMK